jgi:hypothetical protein
VFIHEESEAHNFSDSSLFGSEEDLCKSEDSDDLILSTELSLNSRGGQ